MIKLATFAADSDIDEEPTELAEDRPDQEVDEEASGFEVDEDDQPTEQEMSDELEAIEDEYPNAAPPDAEPSSPIEEPPAAEAPVVVPEALPEKILQVPDSVRERDMRMIEAHQNDIRNHRSIVRSRFLTWSEAKKEAKAAKDSYDLAIADLLNMIDEGPVRQHSLFPAAAITETKKAEAVEVPAVVVEEGEPVAAATSTEEELPAGHYIYPEWQATPIAEFFEHPDVDTNLIELTQDFEIETLGELVIWLDAEENADTIPTYLTEDQLAKVRAAILESKLTTKKPAATAPTDDEEWKSISIDDLDVPRSLKEKLRDSDFLCLGDIADFTSTGKNLTDIKGVGEKKADQIQDALEKIWAIRKEIADNF